MAADDASAAPTDGGAASSRTMGIVRFGAYLAGGMGLVGLAYLVATRLVP